MTEQETPAKARLTLWQRAARVYLEAQGFRAQPGLFRTVADALADHFAASPEPFRLPLALFDQAEVLAAFQANAGPLGFADARWRVESLQADFPHATPEHVRVTLNLLETGGWVNAAFGCIDPASGEAVAGSDAEIASLLKRLSVPDQQAAACERLARIAVEWRAVAPLENVDGSVRVAVAVRFPSLLSGLFSGERGPQDLPPLAGESRVRLPVKVDPTLPTVRGPNRPLTSL